MITWIVIALACGPKFKVTDEPAESSDADNTELVRIYEADQGDRMAEHIDWSVVGPRDQERERRVRALLESGDVHTGADYFHAAMVFQHASGVEGIQMAHELAMTAAALGHGPARWLAAASYDRLMIRLGQKQRFGTQYGSKDGGPMRFEPVEPGVTDAMREALDCPTLDEAKAREASFQKP